MPVTINLQDLLYDMRDLIGDSAEINPEYAKAMVDLLAGILPGEYDAAHDYAHTLLIGEV